MERALGGYRLIEVDKDGSMQELQQSHCGVVLLDQNAICISTSQHRPLADAIQQAAPHARVTYIPLLLGVAGTIYSSSPWRLGVHYGNSPP